MQALVQHESQANVIKGFAKHNIEDPMVQSGVRVIQGPVVVRGPYILGSGTPEDPLRVNISALTSALINSMTSANFIAIRNGIASCDDAGPVGGIGMGSGG